MVKFIFTTYPVATETFLQREVRALRELNFEFEIESLWGGKATKYASPKVYSLFKGLLKLSYWLPYWSLLRPRLLGRFADRLFNREFPPNLINLLENLLGLCFALTEARRLQREGIHHLHGVWATAPATAAWAISQLVGVPYSFAGHAYDLFEDGGDWLLEDKIVGASFIRSSTQRGVNEFIRRGAPAEKVHLVRRGLNEFPPFEPRIEWHQPLRILSVGRLVEKMGYFQQLELYAQLKRQGLQFTARIIGGGPLHSELENRIKQLKLEKEVVLEGRKPYNEVECAYQWCDVFLFTGIVSKSGDQAGLPNAIAEAMAWGRLVIATPVGAVEEVIVDGETGVLLSGGDCEESFEIKFRKVNYLESLILRSHTWIIQNFNSSINMEFLLSKIEETS